MGCLLPPIFLPGLPGDQDTKWSSHLPRVTWEEGKQEFQPREAANPSLRNVRGCLHPAQCGGGGGRRGTLEDTVGP